MFVEKVSLVNYTLWITEIYKLITLDHITPTSIKWLKKLSLWSALLQFMGLSTINAESKISTIHYNGWPGPLSVSANSGKEHCGDSTITLTNIWSLDAVWG